MRIFTRHDKHFDSSLQSLNAGLELSAQAQHEIWAKTPPSPEDYDQFFANPTSVDNVYVVDFLAGNVLRRPNHTKLANPKTLQGAGKLALSTSEPQHDSAS